MHVHVRVLKNGHASNLSCYFRPQTFQVTYRISQVQETDEGLYVLVIENEKGSAKANAFLLINGNKIIIAKFFQ